MARINIEDKLFTDSRWSQLIIKVQDQYKALGLVSMAWMIAQKNWLKHGHIPAKAWPKELDVLIEVELANRREDGSVYVKGSRKAFAWLEQKVEAGAKGGAVKSEKKAKAARENGKQGGAVKSKLASKEPKRNPSEPKQSEAESSEPKPLPLSLTPSSFSSSNSFSDSNSDSEFIPETETKAGGSAKQLNREVWNAYCQSYKARYGIEPVRNATVNSKISQIAKRLGPDAVEVVKFFLRHNEGFYIKKVHDIGLCLADCESLWTQWKTGTQVTSQKVKGFEKVVGQIELMKDAEKGGF